MKRWAELEQLKQIMVRAGKMIKAQRDTPKWEILHEILKTHTDIDHWPCLRKIRKPPKFQWRLMVLFWTFEIFRFCARHHPSQRLMWRPQRHQLLNIGMGQTCPSCKDIFFYLLDVDVDDVAKVVQKLFARLLFVFSFEFLQIDG